jgi:hypothetical protein
VCCFSLPLALWRGPELQLGHKDVTGAPHREHPTFHHVILSEAKNLSSK